MKIFKKIFHNQKGFTLIELIIVIAILGILAAILIPQFNDFQTKASKKATLAEARSSATVFEALISENAATIDSATIAASSGVLAGNISDIDTSTRTFTYTARTYTAIYTAGIWSGSATT